MKNWVEVECQLGKMGYGSEWEAWMGNVCGKWEGEDGVDKQRVWKSGLANVRGKKITPSRRMLLLWGQVRTAPTLSSGV